MGGGGDGGVDGSELGGSGAAYGVVFGVLGFGVFGVFGVFGSVVGRLSKVGVVVFENGNACNNTRGILQECERTHKYATRSPTP